MKNEQDFVGKQFKVKDVIKRLDESSRLYKLLCESFADNITLTIIKVETVYYNNREFLEITVFGDIGMIVYDTKEYQALMYACGLCEQDTNIHDIIEHPNHYTSGKIEVWDFIIDQKLNYCLGNAVKYISRAGRKNPDKYVEDLQKAIQYLKKEISVYEKG